MREHLSSLFLIYSFERMFTVYFDICRGKCMYFKSNICTYLSLYAPVYVHIHAARDNVRKYVQKTSVQQAELQQVSKKGNNHSSRVFNALTFARTRMCEMDIRNMCDVTYTVHSKCACDQAALICTLNEF